MLEIIWYHLRSAAGHIPACLADLRARRLGDLYYERHNTKDFVINEHREWRLR